jgi:hypothetical protein
VNARLFRAALLPSVMPEQRDQQNDRNWYADQPKQNTSTKSHVDLQLVAAVKMRLECNRARKVPSSAGYAAMCAPIVGTQTSGGCDPDRHL